MRIGAIVGRSDDMLIIRGVNLFPSRVEALIMGFSELAPYYQLVVTREGALDSLTVEVEAQPSLSEDDFHPLGQRVAGHIKAEAGVSCEVAVKAPGELPRSEGKAVRVRDLRTAR